MKKYHLLSVLCLSLAVALLFSCKKTNQPENALADSTKQDALTSAAIYYVATNGNNGSTTPTNINTPWQTIQHALDNAPSGSIIEIRGGTYYGKVFARRRLNGTAAAPTIIRSRAGETAVLDANNTGFLWDAIFTIGADATSSAQCQYIQLQRLKLQNGYWFGVLINSYCNNIVVDGCSTFNTRASGVFCERSSYITVKYNKIEKACQAPSPRVNGIGSQECISISNSHHFYVHNNEVFNVTALGEGGEGIDAKNNSHTGEINSNNIHDLARGGIYVDAYASEAYNIKIYSNSIKRTMHGILVAAEENGYTHDIHIYNNLSYLNSEMGFILLDFGGGLIKNLFVENNTFYKNGTNARTGTGFSNWGGDIVLYASDPANANLNVRNNICYNSGTAYDFSIKIDQPGVTTVSNNFTFGHKAIGPLANYPIGNTADPLLIDAAAENFRLQAGSPARNAGYNNSWLTTKDFDHKTRTLPVDIGAFEY
ncbi:MAG: hypothetical protein H7Y86_09110 [Rhizobacter sp.]|nr:hypothetical protein [Ferruginibacter sp.]